MCIYNPERQSHPGLHEKQHGQFVKAGNSSPQLQSCETPPGDLHSVLGLVVQERHETVRVGPWEGHENGQMSGIPLLCRKAERVFQPGEEKATGRPYCGLLEL